MLTGGTEGHNWQFPPWERCSVGKGKKKGGAEMQAWHFPGSCRLPLKLHYPGHQGLSCLLRAVHQGVEGVLQLGRLGLKGPGQMHHSPTVSLRMRGFGTLKLYFFVFIFFIKVWDKSGDWFGFCWGRGQHHAAFSTNWRGIRLRVKHYCFFSWLVLGLDPGRAFRHCQ